MDQNGYTPFVFYLYFCIKNIDTNNQIVTI